jgi:hypothetical protein
MTELSNVCAELANLGGPAVGCERPVMLIWRKLGLRSVPWTLISAEESEAGTCRLAGLALVR